jgi:hypothetical protein
MSCAEAGFTLPNWLGGAEGWERAASGLIVV